MAFDEQMFYNVIGHRIRAARQSCKPRMSQAQLAEKLKISRASVVNIEAGRQHPPLHVLWQIAEALNTELSAFIPTRDEYSAHNLRTELGKQIAARIEAVPDATERRLLTEFLDRLKEQQ